MLDMPYDKEHLCIVEAADESSAREIAENEVGNGGIWLSPVRSSCQVLTVTGAARHIASAGA
jgi:hypothetical protein